jgi:protein tyrosine phosphatase (PTP) superfamily phosphohydrolase (DUF442 family)
MPNFELPTDLKYNRAHIKDPVSYVREAGCTSWLYLVGDEFASMPGGMSYEQVQESVGQSAQVISDPPRILDLHLARKHIEVLDALPRPTLISCRSGPRASAVAYMYAGIKSGSAPDEVIAKAESDDAPFCAFPEYKEWVRISIETLSKEAQ